MQCVPKISLRLGQTCKGCGSQEIAAAAPASNRLRNVFHFPKFHRQRALHHKLIRVMHCMSPKKQHQLYTVQKVIM
jgi:hypothetical protein